MTDDNEQIPVDYEITITHEKGNWQASHLGYLLIAAGYDVRSVERTSGGLE